ncbi:MAG: flippase activity-associated protein Agl23 [Acidobacteriota bacterium]
MRVGERLVPWALLALSGALRLAALDLRPLHHDEGSNAIFVMRLLEEGAYRYDPSNFHGPLLFYLTALAIGLLGDTTWAFRIAPALLGTALAPMAWGLKDALGRPGAASAGLLLAVSPSMVYYARDNIHETYLVFFTLLLVVAVARGLRRDGARGPSPAGRAAWIAAAGGAAAGMVATKETSALILLALGAALLLSGGAGLKRPDRRQVVWALAAFVLVSSLLYSHFLADPAGLLGPFAAIGQWGRRAVAASGHEKPWWYFAALLAREEWAVLAGALGAAGLAARPGRRFARFLLLWGAGLLVVHSLIPYKTPWLGLNIILPLALAGGGAFGRLLVASASRPRRAVAAAALAIPVSLSAWRAASLCFARFDDPASPLVYVQTSRDALRLVAAIEAAAARDPRGRSMPIDIVSPDYLPLNWYLRRFERVAYYGGRVPGPRADVVIARADAAEAVAARLGPGFAREEYDLRPGVRLILFVRRGGPDL